jgi:DNA-binding NtrC family response regulator
VTPVPTFLLVDDVDDNRLLLSRTLLRKFGGARIVECIESEEAFAAVKARVPTAIIVHRTRDADAVQLVSELRKISAAVPIIVVSGREQCPEAITAGANAFLNYEAWLRIGTVVEEVLSPGYVKALTKSPFQPGSDFLGYRRRQG